MLIKQDLWLARCAALGFLVFLLAPWVLPSNKIYHQLIIALLWLPALLSLFRQDLRPNWRLPECWLYLLFSVWVLVVIALQGTPEHLGKAKLPLYVGLSFVGIWLASRNEYWSVEQLLFFAALLGGLGAAYSWLEFYWLQGYGLGSRLSAHGLWDTPIPAAHAVGALAILGALLLPNLRQARHYWLLFLLVGLSSIGFMLFLISSQTRGVWIALLATLLFVCVIDLKRQHIFLLLLVFAVLLAIFLINADFLLQRGASYRPQLWRGGIDLIRQNPIMGLGFDTYHIKIPELASSFKHPHNLFLDIGVRLGLIGLALFMLLWGCAAWRGWRHRQEPLGKALLALLVFSSVSLLTDGIGLWLKPNAEWFVTWLPLAISLILAGREHAVADGSAYRL
ncbi:MAG: O-antigen ligase family protein [Gammaproteobacteria bacterium]|nr:O-antigen ligase family protein [Gammaproteobacteria bacterium]MBU2154867.1 O-antigen ligase family protein [Gammaproteobacteria bacterium]MBU2255650.1 O-antigen ligase family protein [Gammaproteobacteria bacterium]MBU2296532.1 O-antigen ligase family protein [Gammaproteobacteria bacterium]